MPTKPDTSGHLARELTVAQLNAIDLLVIGATDGEAAEAVGVTRQTVNTWRNHDPVFIASLNARRLELWGGACDKLRALLPKAMETLEGALAEGRDWRAAAEVIKLAGLDLQGQGVPNLGPYSIGPADPEAVLDGEIRRRRAARDPIAAMLGEFLVSDSERLAVLRELADRVKE